MFQICQQLISQYFRMRIGSGEYPLEIFGGLLLVILIVYAEQVPINIRTFMDSVTGRLIAIVSILAAVRCCGLIYGILIVLAYLVILHTISNSEGFANTQITKPVIQRNKRWYIEKILGEHPSVIDTVEVFTAKDYDSSSKSML